MDATTESIFDHIEADPRDVGAYEDAVAWLAHRRGEAGRALLAEGRWLRRLLADAPRGGWATGQQLERLLSCLRDSLTIDAPYDLDCFMQAMEFDRDPKRRFWLPRRELLMPMCRELQWLGTDPDARGLIIASPPRVGKSTISGFAAAWNMGRHPHSASLMVSYSDTICEHFHEQELSFVAGGEYRFAEIFPDSPLTSKSAKYKTITLAGPLAYPTLTCRSIEGTLTGSTEVGEDGWLYADDLVKDLEEAMSPTRLEKKWSAYVNQAYDRRKEGARLLNVGTIWDVADPQMRMMRMHEGDPAYRALLIPAVDPDTGESNFDYGNGVGFSTDYYRDMRAVTDPVTWAAKYEAKPRVRQGQLYAPEALQRYLALPDGEPEAVMAVADTKDRGEDFCVVPVVKRWGGRWYLTDCLCDNGNPDALRYRVAALLDREGVQSCRFESNSAGGRFAKDVADILSDRGSLCAVTTKYTTSNKETRILASSPWVINNLTFRDPSLYAPNSDYGRMMDQLVSYTLEGSVAHDDAPDALSMLADLLSARRRSTAIPIARPF